MTTYLLDVNVMVSLLNAKSPHFAAARQWFKAEGSRSWCTSPIAQNGAIRILRNPAVSHHAVTFQQVAESVSSLISIGNHQFIPDTVSLLDRHLFEHQVHKNGAGSFRRQPRSCVPGAVDQDASAAAA